MTREKLVQTLELVGKALGPPNIVPMFANFCFTGKQVYAYNDQIGIVADCGFLDKVGIHGQTLLGLLKSSKAEEVGTISFKDHAVVIKVGESKFSLPYFEPSDFIFQPPVVGGACKVTTPFMEAVQDCLITVGADQAYESFRGVFVDGKDLFSCDGDAITQAVGLAICDSPVMLPTEFCEAVSKVWYEVGPTEAYLGIDKEAGWAEFSTDNGYSVYGRLKEVKPPGKGHRQLLIDTMQDRPFEPIIVPFGLDQALSRARVLADTESAPTAISVANDVMKLHTQTPMGEVTDLVPAPGHPDVEARVSAALIQRTLKRCHRIQFYDNCTAASGDPNLFVLTSNMS